MVQKIVSVVLIVSAERFVLDYHSAAVIVAAVVAIVDAADAVGVELALPGSNKNRLIFQKFIFAKT